MKNFILPTLKINEEMRKKLLPWCRLSLGEVWIDPIYGHRIGCLDATNSNHITTLMEGEKAQLAIQDPPYNFIIFEMRSVQEFIDWCKEWIKITNDFLDINSSLYVWMGADQKKDFQPLPDFMLMMRQFNTFTSRSFITLRNQRGYGTQKNWMAIRQECLFYIKGNPNFSVQYTDIPKVLKGYYKKVKGQMTDNIQRSKSKNIRSGNVWIDIQQVFYRMEENVNGCYAQKPLKSIERLIKASSQKDDIVIDFFGHSGTTLIAAEQLERRCFTCDKDPIFAEIMIRRLEHLRKYGNSGWQNKNPFVKEFYSLRSKKS